MARIPLNHGTVKEDHTGDDLFDLFANINLMTLELYKLTGIVPATSTTAGVQEAVDYIYAQGIPGIVSLLPVEYDFTAGAVTARPGVSILGVPPLLTITSDTPEGSWQFSNGTVLVGNGLGNGIVYNNTPLGSPIADFASNGLVNVRIGGFGLRNFVRGIDIGATNSYGALLSFFDNIMYIDCSEWGVNFENFQYCKFRHISGRTTSNSQNGGQRYASTVSNSVLIPGDSTFDFLWHAMQYRLNRGICFHVGNGSSLNDLILHKAQVNRVNEAEASAAATMTGSSPNIGVPDSSIFPVGIPCYFTTTANGFTANLCYFVISSAANVIQVSATPDGSAISATGSTAITIKTGGFPSWEFRSLAGGSNYCTNFTMTGMAAETVGSIPFVMQNVSGGNFQINDLSVSSHTHLVMRGATRTKIDCDAIAAGIITDLDNGAAGVVIDGSIQTQRGQPGTGFRRGVVMPTTFTTLTAGAAAGTGGTVTKNYGTAMFGQLQVTVGSGPVAGVVMTLGSLPTKGNHSYYPVITPANAAANALTGAAKARVQTTGRSTDFDIVVDQALVQGTTYIWNYMI